MNHPQGTARFLHDIRLRHAPIYRRAFIRSGPIRERLQEVGRGRCTIAPARRCICAPALTLHLPIVSDPIDGHIGPLAGVLGGMRWARENSTARQIVTVPADTPFFPQDLVERFLDGIGDAEIAIARSRGRSHPVVGLWPIEMADPLECWLRDVRDRKAETWVRSRRLVEIAFDGDEESDPFFNVNTPQDAIAAATRAKTAR
jgi:molybdopterin-guanine dinucleotide biosynthesis protein A